MDLSVNMSQSNLHILAIKTLHPVSGDFTENHSRARSPRLCYREQLNRSSLVGGNGKPFSEREEIAAMGNLLAQVMATPGEFYVFL